MRTLLVCLLLLSGAWSGCAAPAPSDADPTDEGPAWRFTDSQQKEWTEHGILGEPTLLFVMATWCGTCRQMAPALARLHDEFGDDVRFLSVGFDPSETDADLDRWREERGHPWPHGVDVDQQVVRHHQVRTQSTVILLDAEGGTVFSRVAPSEADLRDALARVTAQAPNA